MVGWVPLVYVGYEETVSLAGVLWVWDGDMSSLRICLPCQDMLAVVWCGCLFNQERGWTSQYVEVCRRVGRGIK